MKNGKTLLFWSYIWLQETSLALAYPNLFSIVQNDKLTVFQALDNNCAKLVFRRRLVGIYLLEWNQLKEKLDNFHLDPSECDILLWRWSAKNTFSVHSLYTWLEFGGVKNLDFQSIWHSNIPLKIKIFLWLIQKNRIQTR